MRSFSSIISENFFIAFTEVSELQLSVGDENNNNSKKGIPLKNLLDCPLPMIGKATKDQEQMLTETVHSLANRLSKADSMMHKNSAEFKKMKSALETLDKGITSGVSPEELGSRLEALQEASMEYVKAKGVGTQYSQLGKDRMDIALDICSMSAKYMDYYASNLRIREVADFEKENFGTKFTKDGIYDFSLSNVEDFAMDLFGDDLENENDEMVMS